MLFAHLTYYFAQKILQSDMNEFKGSTQIEQKRQYNLFTIIVRQLLVYYKRMAK